VEGFPQDQRGFNKHYKSVSNAFCLQQITFFVFMFLFYINIFLMFLYYYDFDIKNKF